MNKEVLFSASEIAARVEGLADSIAADYAGRPLVLVAILNGGVVLAADILRSLWARQFTQVEFDTLKISSYGQQFSSSGTPQVDRDIQLDICGKHVLVIEDLIDTGLTLQKTLDHLQAKGPASLEILALLAKPPQVQQVQVPIRYLGFSIENVWVEGYGIDSAERGRGNPNIMRCIA